MKVTYLSPNSFKFESNPLDIFLKIFMLMDDSSSSKNLNENYQQQYEQLNQQYGSKLYDFETNFLVKYIQETKSDKTLIKDLFNYLEKCASSRSDQNFDRDMKFAQKDLALFFLEYLIQKHILGSDKIIIPETPESKKKICSKRMTIQELEEREKNLLLDQKEILHVLCQIQNSSKVFQFINANIGINEPLAGSLFVTRFLHVDAPLVEAVESEVQVNPHKMSIKKLTYNYWRDIQSIGEPFLSFHIETKLFGAQFGGRLITNGSESKKWYFKTHQEGSRVESSTRIMYLSKSISLAKPVNINELFVYKILEKLEWGPKVHFVSNPFIENDIFLVTNDLEEEIDGFKMAIHCKSTYNSLNPAQKEDLKIRATAFDLLNRILMLSDLNEGNYGLTTNNSIKVIDFRAPIQIYALNELVFYDSFLEVNGLVYPKHPHPDMPDPRLVPSILKESIADEKQKINEGIAGLRLINKEQLEQAVQESKDEVIAFLSAQDSIADCQIAQHIGIDLSHDSKTLTIYAQVIMGNYSVVKDCLTKKLESLKEN